MLTQFFTCENEINQISCVFLRLKKFSVKFPVFPVPWSPWTTVKTILSGGDICFAKTHSTEKHSLLFVSKYTVLKDTCFYGQFSVKKWVSAHQNTLRDITSFGRWHVHQSWWLHSVYYCERRSYANVWNLPERKWTQQLRSFLAARNTTPTKPDVNYSIIFRRTAY